MKKRVDIYLHADRCSNYEAIEKIGMDTESDIGRKATFIGNEEKMTYEVDTETGDGVLVAVNDKPLNDIQVDWEKWNKNEIDERTKIFLQDMNGIKSKMTSIIRKFEEGLESNPEPGGKLALAIDTLKLIKDKMPRCDCMDAPGLAAECLKSLGVE